MDMFNLSLTEQEHVVTMARCFLQQTQPVVDWVAFNETEVRSRLDEVREVAQKIVRSSED